MVCVCVCACVFVCVWGGGAGGCARICMYNMKLDIILNIKRGLLIAQHLPRFFKTNSRVIFIVLTVHIYSETFV